MRVSMRLEKLEYHLRSVLTPACTTCKGWGMLLIREEDLNGQPPPKLCPECGKRVAVKVYPGWMLDAL